MCTAAALAGHGEVRSSSSLVAPSGQTAVMVSEKENGRSVAPSIGGSIGSISCASAVAT